MHLANARSAQSARVALDAAGRHLIAVDSQGTLLWATPQASKLLSSLSHQPLAKERIASSISKWFVTRNQNPAIHPTIEVSSDDTQLLQLNFLGAIGADEHLFRLTASGNTSDEQLLRDHFALTTREAEVLAWRSGAKTWWKLLPKPMKS